MASPVQIGDCELYLGDCREILPGLGKVDAVVTDPPYGVARDKGFGGSQGFNGSGTSIGRRVYDGEWDQERPHKECFDLMLQKSSFAVIFGGNFFTDYLPAGKHWIVWDKLNTMPTFGDCELVWTNLPRNSVKKLTYEYNGLLGKEEERHHPTQKPVGVMRWVINHLPKNCDLILDPFMGAGTTGVAAAKLGKKFIGVELQEPFFNIACRRIEAAYKQPDLFVAQPKPTKQEAML
jgi:DNA modification methylase